MPSQEKILITGASGQIGTSLTSALEAQFGADAILATDIKKPETSSVEFVMMDILNFQRVREILADHEVTQVYHLAAILSASGEWNPQKTWNVNMSGLLNLLESCVEQKIQQFFFPSTIAVFGGPTPKSETPQYSAMVPTTVYGMSKAAGELWCNYYHKRYGLDIRSVRYPGIISHKAPPGGGTTDYAVEIFHEALRTGSYNCFLKSDTRLPMLYMPDAIRATMNLMQAPPDAIGVRTSYNLAGLSFTPAELASEIQNHLGHFQIAYTPDFRQEIAESWTESINDSFAHRDWGWRPKYDLASIVTDMLTNLSPPQSN